MNDRDMDYNYYQFIYNNICFKLLLLLLLLLSNFLSNLYLYLHNNDL